MREMSPGVGHLLRFGAFLREMSKGWGHLRRFGVIHCLVICHAVPHTTRPVPLSVKRRVIQGGVVYFFIEPVFLQKIFNDILEPGFGHW